MSNLLWQPASKAIATSQMTAFQNYVNSHYQQNIQDYSALHHWSITHLADFWQAVWSFCHIIATQPAEIAFIPGENMQNSQWFPGATLNFAENLLRYRDEQTAIIFVNERKDEPRRISYAELYQQVTALAAYLHHLGITSGDRVVGYLPNCPETVIAMLATTSLGAIWSACSSDFGVDGLVNRFEQIKPKLLFAADGHYYNGKTYRHLEEIRALQQELPTLKHTILVPFLGESTDISTLSNSILFQDCLTPSPPLTVTDPHPFVALSFSHPAYILYSSGTTGKPKCMVHGAGGTLIEHLKELILHTDLRRQDTIFFYTTCTWMMWHWLVSSLAVGATIVLYEGSPFHPQIGSLFNLVDQLKITVMGVGAKYLESLEKNHFSAKQFHSLQSLRSILTTGSPLLPESFDYVYQYIKSDVQLSSISGGSDIIGCFALGNPNLPVYRGELQCIGLGLDVKILNELGYPIVGIKGELVCAAPFPSMPIYFWHDANNEKYEKAYFHGFPGVWTHGDFAEMTEHGGLIIYGRSDATLNPGGVRIGTAEIYQQLEKFPEIIDFLAIGQPFHGSERIILFVMLKFGETLTPELIQQIKVTLLKNTSPHHVPALIIHAPDLPRTRNGKTSELAVKKIIQGFPLSNVDALENPQALDFFKHLPEIEV